MELHQNIQLNNSKRITQWYVLLSLIGMALASALVVEYDGNMSFGFDHWPIIYYTDRGIFGNFLNNNRPLNLLNYWIHIKLFGASYLSHIVAWVGYKVACAFVLYLVLEHYYRRDFAYSCSALMSVYMTEDWNFLLSFPDTSPHYGAILFGLLGVLMLINYLKYDKFQHMVGAVLFLTSASLIREAIIPPLLFATLLLYFVEKRITRKHLLTSIPLLLAFILVGMNYAAPLIGLKSVTYASNLFNGIEFSALLRRTVYQLHSAFTHLIVIDLPAIRRMQLNTPLMLVVGAYFLGNFLLKSKDADSGCAPQPAQYYGIHVALGIVLTVSGFVAYLPTSISETNQRTLFMSLPGIALSITAAVWMIASLLHSGSRQSFIMLSTSLLMLASVAMTGKVQEGYMYGLDYTWETHSRFMRSLSHQVPDVKANTLFIYWENQELGEQPFIVGFTFEYAVRYFYNDKANGLVPNEANTFSWTATDEGISVTPNPGTVSPFRYHTWDEVIVIEKTVEGTVRIVDELPAEFFTTVRQDQYDPYNRIIPSYVNNRIITFFTYMK